MLFVERYPYESARDYALRTIKLNIGHMYFLPGSKINDQEIAAQLGISRTPVREALIELSEYNLVEMFPQKGSFVAPVSYQMVREAAVTRDVLECAAVGICCKIEDSSVFEKLAENNELMKLYVNRTANDKIIELDFEFHKELFRIAGMPSVHSFLSSLEIHYLRIVGLSFFSGKEKSVITDHQAILDAILEHDEEKAVAAMKKHLNFKLISKEEVLKLYPDCIFDE